MKKTVSANVAEKARKGFSGQAKTAVVVNGNRHHGVSAHYTR